MSPTLKRRRLQFSLRTLIVLVTIVCVLAGWFGNKVRIVRERSAMLHRIFENSRHWGIVFDQPMGRTSGQNEYGRIGIGVTPQEVMTSLSWPPLQMHPSALEKWLGEGDQCIRAIGIPDDADPADVAQVSELFPEVTVYRTNDAMIARMLRNAAGGPTGLAPLSSADREHLAGFYNAIAANHSKPSVNAPPTHK
jgi:hypothetical protein